MVRVTKISATVSWGGGGGVQHLFHILSLRYLGTVQLAVAVDIPCMTVLEHLKTYTVYVTVLRSSPGR